MRMGLVGRVLLSAGLPTLLAAAAFVTMVVSIAQLQGAQASAAASQRLVIAAEGLSRAVGDVGTAAAEVRAGKAGAAEALSAAVNDVAQAAATLTSAVGSDPGQRARAAELDSTAESYAAGVQATGQGSDAAFTARLDAFLDAERADVTDQQHSATAATKRAVAAAVIGLVASVVAMIWLGVYLTRAVTLPVRHAGAVAREFADGNLSARLPATGAGEIRDLQVALNDMAAALAGARSELAASRARISAADWRSRRELERNLHDGLQQRLVSLSLDVRGLAADLPAADPGLRVQTDRLADGLAGAVEELREIARGIQPAVLTESGLRAALRTLARRSALPVEVSVNLPARPPADIESAAYYFTAEAITNTIKHARATGVDVTVGVAGGELRVTVADDGVGGAGGGGGSGLVGLRDRIEAAGGRMAVHSPPGEGTTLTALLPLGADGGGLPGSR
jgi:signal transduction histidine kinase